MRYRVGQRRDPAPIGPRAAGGDMVSGLSRLDNVQTFGRSRLEQMPIRIEDRVGRVQVMPDG